jgi:PAS domain S-box-containing protein
VVDKSQQQELEELREQIRQLRKVNADLEDEIIDLRLENEDLQVENEDLYEREALVRELIEKAPDAFFAHDLNGRFVFANDFSCKVMGCSREEILKLSVQDVECGITPEQIQMHWDDVAEGKTVHTEGLIKRNDDTTLPMDIRIGLFEASGNQVIYGIARDITERKQFEDRLRQVHKMEAVGTLAGGIAHDFNNILGIILGCSELAGDPLPDDHPAREYLEEIKLAVLRAKEVIRQLLSFSQASDHCLEPLSMVPLVKETLKLMRATISANIELEADIPANCYMVKANPAQIHQVVINLCANAAHATRDGGSIEVRLRNRVFENDNHCKDALGLHGKYLQLTIRDTGYGMPPDITDRIFDPYFTTKEEGKGSGMGLAVVHGIVESLDGKIRVKSRHGQGTVFNIFLPALDRVAQVELVVDHNGGAIPKGNERVLVVDNEALIINGLRERLEGLGYVVDSFMAPLKVLDAFKRQPEKYDLLITDMAMPKMTGEMLISLVKQIRADIPIILCTGYSERVDVTNPKAVGADKIMLKPIDRRELAVSVRQVLDAVPKEAR